MLISMFFENPHAGNITKTLGNFHLAFATSYGWVSV